VHVLDLFLAILLDIAIHIAIDTVRMITASMKRVPAAATPAIFFMVKAFASSVRLAPVRSAKIYIVHFLPARYVWTGILTMP
jgi:hypothetical protein